MSRWSWWLTSDGGLFARIAVGGGFFLTLAIIDLLKNRSRATRWREYAFLLAATAFAMLYGMINDTVAVRISWEYFYYGKGLSAQLGPTLPPDMTAMDRGAVAIGLRATWTVGLLIGALLLIANNPRPDRPRAPYKKLLQGLLKIGAAAALTAIIGGILGSRGWLNWTNAELAATWNEDLFRPHRFLAAYGINLGGYIGGAFCTIFAIIKIKTR